MYVRDNEAFILEEWELHWKKRLDVGYSAAVGLVRRRRCCARTTMEASMADTMIRRVSTQQRAIV